MTGFHSDATLHERISSRSQLKECLKKLNSAIDCRWTRLSRDMTDLIIYTIRERVFCISFPWAASCILRPANDQHALCHFLNQLIQLDWSSSEYGPQQTLDRGDDLNPMNAYRLRNIQDSAMTRRLEMHLYGLYYACSQPRM
jgi:hypothetical protein